jgi:hypothetical protein
MANQNIITYGLPITTVDQMFYSPSAVLASSTTPINTTYCFIGSVTPWADDNNPPIPTQDQKYLKSVLNNIIATKRITTNDLMRVIQRIDWNANTVYSYYRDDVDILQIDPEDGSLVNNFYIRNRYDQVFKCLWNNNGAVSTSEPYFEPGTYQTNNIYKGTDNYKWKYMYTIDAGSKLRFMDKNWMPVPDADYAPSSLVNSIGSGDIEVINVLNGGSGYDPTTTVISVNIVGDGVGASANVSVSGGVITDIIVSNPGSGYTYANAYVVVSSSQANPPGNGAVLIAPVSPIAGHAYDPAAELGATDIMFSVDFNGNEGGVIPTNFTYHQVGLIVNPTSIPTEPNAANNDVYRTTTDLIVSTGFGVFQSGEIVFQGSDPTNPNTWTYSGTVAYYTEPTTVGVINTKGTPTTNELIRGTVTNTTRMLFDFTPSTYTVLSGYLSYIENRSGIQRSPDGIEQFRFILGY